MYGQNLRSMTSREALSGIEAPVGVILHVNQVRREAVECHRCSQQRRCGARVGLAMLDGYKLHMGLEQRTLECEPLCRGQLELITIASSQREHFA